MAATREGMKDSLYDEFRAAKIIGIGGINLSGIRRYCQFGTDCDPLAKFSVTTRGQRRLNQHRK